jgi:DNA polymerase III subunit delta'
MPLPTFDQILGQDSAIDALTKAYQANRLPHAMIFAGPVGVGKYTTATALGALYLCHNPKGIKPCNKCDACRVFAAGNHPDFHRVYRQLIRLTKEDVKARDVSAPVIREYLIGPANLKPSMDHGKVFVVEEAELMNIVAQNVLLKTLEEPPPGTLIILLTDNPNSLLPTIRSRSQIIPFAAMDNDTILTELKNREIPAATARNAVKFTDGSLGLAIKWIEDGVIASAVELSTLIDSLLTGKRVPDLQAWFKKAADTYGTKQLEHDEKSSKDQATREGLSLYLKIASDLLRKHFTQEKDPNRLDRICTAIESITRAEMYLDANVNIPLVFQQLTVSLDRALVG